MEKPLKVQVGLLFPIELRGGPLPNWVSVKTRKTEFLQIDSIRLQFIFTTFPSHPLQLCTTAS